MTTLFLRSSCVLLVILFGATALRATDSPQASFQAALREATKAGKDSFGQWIEVIAKPAWILDDGIGQSAQPIDMSLGNAIDQWSSIRLGLEWHEAGDQVLARLERLTERAWKPLPHRVGFSRIALRIRSEGGDPILEMFVSPPESAILFKGRWYEVDGELLNRLLDGIESLAVDLLRGSRQKQTAEVIQRRREELSRLKREASQP